jgi:threonine synthase
MGRVVCTHCGVPYPDEGVPYRCLHCGGVYDYDTPPVFSPHDFRGGFPGLWRYWSTLALPSTAEVLWLGEGNTPLVPLPYAGDKVYLKLESLNPSGSYKDRGTAVLVSWLLARGVKEAVEDSSGNAGASFAAYAARAGLRAVVYVPESASGPKRLQIERYGATLVRVPGPRSAAAQAVLEAVQRGAVYASHAYLPFGLPGIATIAYEIWEQLGQRAPGTVIAPVGHGGLLLGIVRGFQSLEQSGVISRPPYFVGVQAAACAPVVSAFQNRKRVHELTVEERPTLAEGVRVRQPVRLEALLREIPPDCGTFVAIEESEIERAFITLAHQGVYVEPTSALVWAALERLYGKLPEPIVLVITGSGLKYGA